ncbi:MAG: hypothetical protein AAGA09_09735, partial [Pseudomonadota bacterium]
AAYNNFRGFVSRDYGAPHRYARGGAPNPDKNTDGVVDRTEFIEAAGDRFDRLDKDGDGVLSEDERKRRHGRRHRRN